MKNQKGNALVISGIFVTLALAIFVFIISIFFSHVNSILYRVKIDMFHINKSAILAINKNRGNIDVQSYDKKEYKKYFVEALKNNYELDNNLSNKNKLITKIELVEYEIIQSGKKDSFTKKKVNDTVIHTVVKVKISPIILAEQLEDIFIFVIHDDVKLNLLKVE
jgi:hypothetical protein